MPDTVLTSTGKNTIRATTTTFGVSPNPNQMSSSGASTTMGTVWLMTSTGYRTRRASGRRTITTARATPTTAPMTKPTSDSVIVVIRWPGNGRRCPIRPWPPERVSAARTARRGAPRPTPPTHRAQQRRAEPAAPIAGPSTARRGVGLRFDVRLVSVEHRLGGWCPPPARFDVGHRRNFAVTSSIPGPWSPAPSASFTTVITRSAPAARHSSCTWRIRAHTSSGRPSTVVPGPRPRR